MAPSSKVGFAKQHYGVVGSSVVSLDLGYFGGTPYNTSGVLCMNTTGWSELPSTMTGGMYENGLQWAHHSLIANINGVSVEVALGESHEVRIYDSSLGSVWRDISTITTSHKVLSNIYNSGRSDYFWPVTSRTLISTNYEKIAPMHNASMAADHQNVLASVAQGTSSSGRICVRTYPDV